MLTRSQKQISKVVIERLLRQDNTLTEILKVINIWEKSASDAYPVAQSLKMETDMLSPEQVSVLANYRRIRAINALTYHLCVAFFAVVDSNYQIHTQDIESLLYHFLSNKLSYPDLTIWYDWQWA